MKKPNKSNGLRQEDQKGSPDRFGYEWNKYPEIIPAYEEQFKRWTELIPKEEWKDKAFLDVGCGMGRNSYWPIKYGAQRGVGIDIDKRSLNAAQANLSMLKNYEIKEISAYDIPYENEFDIVFSIGVIHHLQDPKRALEKMVKAAKVNGKILIWVYGQENMKWIKNIFNPIRKSVFSNLPISITHFLSIFPTALLWVFLRLRLGKIEYFHLLRKFSFWHLRSIVFDQMLPEIANYWKKEEVLDLMKSAGLRNIQISDVNGMSWCAVGEK